ncbi:Zn-dependent oxidoreductase [Halogeometricum borinquense]|uniref:Zn-dependent oxidoreductase n=1 Tax=Halogeometricum borinquense TaxID=60847 RepID=A0A6C0UKK4_9EURY|nr:Zn-dependent oxidoreductase [Halogeometricum borinquense]QIB76042.1 Zn-dependent oxidoreductase [Halogeometricum borinquense]
MGQNDSSREVACELTEEQETERSEEVRSRLITNYVGVEESEDGLKIRFEGTEESLLAAARFISSELKCCAFAEYEITVSPPYEETALTITGPDGTREMFRNGLVARLEAKKP